MPKSEWLPSLFTYSLFFKEQIEQLAPIALKKRAIMSNLLRSLMTKEQLHGVICYFHKRITLLLFGSQKTSE